MERSGIACLKTPTTEAGSPGSAARAMRLLGGSTLAYMRPRSGTILYLLRCDSGF